VAEEQKVKGDFEKKGRWALEKQLSQAEWTLQAVVSG
jgi:hypothetical protein